MYQDKCFQTGDYPGKQAKKMSKLQTVMKTGRIYMTGMAPED